MLRVLARTKTNQAQFLEPEQMIPRLAPAPLGAAGIKFFLRIERVFSGDSLILHQSKKVMLFLIRKSVNRKAKVFRFPPSPVDRSSPKFGAMDPETQAPKITFPLPSKSNHTNLTTMKNLRLMSLLAFFLVSCSTQFKYQQATGKWYGGFQGYFEKELEGGEILLSYAWIGGYEWSSRKEEDLQKLRAFWIQRAQELCPKGYAGDPQPKYPWESENERLSDCVERYCSKYPIVEGKVLCNGPANKT